jgi:putative tricarboxylic transport membrane protein
MYFREILGGLFWLGISIYVCLISIPISVGSLHSPGPGFLPFWAGIIFGTFSITLVITNIVKGKKEGKISDLWKGTEWHKVILVLVSLFIYAILLPRLGYLIATSALLTLFFGMTRRQRLWVPVVSGLVTALLSYLVFYRWLDVQLPKGMFGF